MQQKLRGFSLIELMFAVAIMAILLAVGYPSYIGSMKRSHRNDATAALNTVANDLERFFANNGNYTADVTQLSLQTSNGKAVSAGGYYHLTVGAGVTGNIATSYRIVAVPDPDESQAHDTDCPSFSLSSTGERLPDPGQSKCW